MAVNGILTGQNRDTATVLSIKEDTSNLREDAETILGNTATLAVQSNNILNILRGDEIQGMKRYGYRIKKNEPDPKSRIEYIYDAVGMTPAAVNLVTGEMDLGDWANLWFVRDNYPCMLKFDGSIGEMLDPNDYSKTTSGAASNYDKVSYEGNAMAAIPRCYVKRWEDDRYEYFSVCQERYDSSYFDYAHIAADGTEKDYAYAPMFKGMIDTNEILRSIGGQYPGNTTTATVERTAALKNNPSGGNGWDIRSWALTALIADLLTLMAKNDNSQEAFGEGYTTGGSSGNLANTGRLYKKGQFYGTSVNNNKTDSGVKVFHIEDFWGNRWDRLVGLIYSSGVYLAKMDRTGSGYNLTGSGYKNLGKSMSGTSGSYIKTTFSSENGRLPLVLGGSSSTYCGDGGWYAADGVRVARAGGCCNSGALCGSRYLPLDHAASISAWALGASPEYV